MSDSDDKILAMAKKLEVPVIKQSDFEKGGQMSEAQKVCDCKPELGGCNLCCTFVNTKELRRYIAENAALSEKLKEADKVLKNLVSFLDDTVHWVAPINRALLDERKQAAKDYLSKTPKKEEA